MPALLKLVIIRLLWIREDDIIIRFTTDILIINSYRLTILIKVVPVILKIKKLMAVLFIILVKRARRYQKPLTVFKVLLKDIINVRELQRGTVGGVCMSIIWVYWAMKGEGEKREKNPLERLVTNKGGRGSPLSGDQPRTQWLFMTLSPSS